MTLNISEFTVHEPSGGRWQCHAFSHPWNTFHSPSHRIADPVPVFTLVT